MDPSFVTTTASTPPGTAETSGTVLKTERPITSGSNRPSSLHQAVLDVAGEQEGRDEEEVEKKVEANVGRKMEDNARPKGYSGAWP